MIIAIDGPAASGKGTLARRLSFEFGLKHLDTGRTYRAVAATMRARGDASDDLAAALDVAATLNLEAMARMELSSAEIGEAASKVAVMAPLRAVLVERQRAFAADARAAGFGAVLDGRDVGTVVLPDATVKLFVTADASARARRRSMELFGEPSGARYDAILAALELRDRRDRERPVGALKPAADAMVIDTSSMDADEVFAAARGLVERVRTA